MEISVPSAHRDYAAQLRQFCSRDIGRGRGTARFADAAASESRRIRGVEAPRETKEWWDGRNRCAVARLKATSAPPRHVTKAKGNSPSPREGRKQASAVSGEGGCSRYNAATSSVAARDKPPRPSPKALHAFDPPDGRVNFLTCNYVWKQPRVCRNSTDCGTRLQGLNCYRSSY